MAQRFGLYGDLTVDENMRFYADLFGISRRERESLAVRLLEMTRMTPFRKRPASKLSGGMKQKLALMCTLLHHPEVLFLDEPTNGVDPVSRRDFWQILHQLIQEGLTVFVATAYLDEAERCDRVGLLHRGRLIRCDTPAALRNSIDDDCYAIKNCDLREAAAWLHGMPEVTSVEPAGAALHVFVKSGSAPARPPGCSVERITPSLEDVFIALLRRETFQ
jgi:ABC-2 type transport system ATP-binding protein